jgi:hypothetical protein
VTLADADSVPCRAGGAAGPTRPAICRAEIRPPYAVAGGAFEVVACRRYAAGESGAGFAWCPADSDAASVGMGASPAPPL